MVHAEVLKAEWSPFYGSYIVFLRERDGQRYYPLFVQEWEYQLVSEAISQRLAFPHNCSAIADILKSQGVQFWYVELSKRFMGKVEAKVVLKYANHSQSVSCTPGEGMDLALRCRVPIMLDEPLLVGTPRMQNQVVELDHQLEFLREQLQKAVEVEQYEEAARLRDQIQALEKRARCK